MDSLLDVCRVCANKVKDKKRQQNIFKYMRGKLLDNLKLITGVELSPDENLPKFICNRCNMELDLAIKFRERCIFSQKYLDEMHAKMKSKFVSAVRELHEDLIDEEHVEYANDSDQNSEVKSDEINEDALEYEMLTEPTVEEATEEDLSDRDERHWVLVEDSRPAKRSRNFFICVDCGAYFTDEYDYKEHQDSHSQHNECKQFFPCFKCSATFNSRLARKVHQQEMHSGDRNFKCAKCGMTFLEFSAKQRHEKAHINERPYPCLECNKLFNSVSELRAHAIKHENRKFRCEACNMDFNTRQNLIAHSQTHPHKRTMQQMQAEIDLLWEGIEAHSD